MRHKAGCPKLQFFDAGEYEARCTCAPKTYNEVNFILQKAHTRADDFFKKAFDRVWPEMRKTMLESFNTGEGNIKFKIKPNGRIGAKFVKNVKKKPPKRRGK